MKSDNSKTLRLIIYAQSFFGILLIVAMVRGMQFRKVNQFWNGPLSEVRGSYDLYGMAVILLTLAVLLGLLRRKKWGRELAIALNMIAFIITVGIRIFGYLFAIIYFKMPTAYSTLWEMNGELVACLIVSLISILLTIALSRQSIKANFEGGFKKASQSQPFRKRH